MKKVCAILLVLTLLPSVWAQEPEKRWDLTDIYASQAAFKTELSSVHTILLPRIRAYEGQLRNPEALLGMLTLLGEVNTCLQRASVYAGLQISASQTDKQACENQNAVRREAEGFTQGSEKIRLELYALEEEYLKGCTQDNRFADVLPMLLSVLAARETRSETGLLSRYSHLMSLPSDTAALALGPDFHPATIARPDGTKVSATYAEWLRSRGSDDVNYRRAAYEGYHGEVRRHRHVLAAQLDAHIRTAIQEARSAGYDTPLRQALLSRYELPPDTVGALLRNVRDALPLHRKFGELNRLSQGKETAYPWELTPDASQKTYTYEEACAHILDSLSLLGRDYTAKARRMLESHHIDVYPRSGKQGGAFAVSAGERTDPYILLNFSGSYDDMSTLTHELGHAIHMMYSIENNPPLSRDAAISTAETASTAHELLLIEHMLKNASSEDDKRFFTGRYADLIGGTLFGQTQLFAFETSLYATVQSGGSITADAADTLWKKYQQDFRDPGLLIPEAAESYWAAIPHFYRNFYVMNYATSLTAAYALIQPVLQGGKRDAYITLLKAGGSGSAHNLLREAGVNLSEDGPYAAILHRYESLYTDYAKVNSQAA